ncbi:TPA: hypothetical protein ACHH4X_001452 [Streptococcus pneumoniae]
MTKSDTIIELKKQKIVAVIRGNTKEEGLQASIACIKGGIKAIEIAYTNQYAGQIIKELVDLYQDDQSVCIGAGTVLDAVGIGGELNKLASQGNFDRISEIAQQYITLR